MALVTLTNMGVTHMRLGELDEAEKVLEEVVLTYGDAGYDKGNGGYLRARYQLAVLAERQAEMEESAGNVGRALAAYRDALARHRSVYDDRAAYISPNAVDTGKSREACDRCSAAVSRAEGVRDDSCLSDTV